MMLELSILLCRTLPGTAPLCMIDTVPNSETVARSLEDLTNCSNCVVAVSIDTASAADLTSVSTLATASEMPNVSEVTRYSCFGELSDSETVALSAGPLRSNSSRVSDSERVRLCVATRSNVLIP